MIFANFAFILDTRLACFSKFPPVSADVLAFQSIRPQRSSIHGVRRYRPATTIMIFLHRSKRLKKREFGAQSRLKIDFWSKFRRFREPFWRRFFVFLAKLRKCEIREEYNAKRASEPSKTSHSRIDLFIIFHVFSDPPPRDHF